MKGSVTEPVTVNNDKYPEADDTPIHITKPYLSRVLMYCSTCQPAHLLPLFASPPKVFLVFFFFSPCVNNIQSRSLQNLTARAVLCQGCRGGCGSPGLRGRLGRGRCSTAQLGGTRRGRCSEGTPRWLEHSAGDAAGWAGRRCVTCGHWKHAWGTKRCRLVWARTDKRQQWRAV